MMADNPPADDARTLAEVAYLSARSAGAPAAPEPEPAALPPPETLIATEGELQSARLAPRCIVRHLLYADVAQLVAPGGTGKTTLLLYEAVHIALGRPLWGLDVESPGWSLIVTAEDQRERILARLREILTSMELAPGERTEAVRGVRVWDVTGRQVRLVTAADGNIMLTTLADSIVEMCRADPPAVVVFDPMISFGASEGMVNDNEQGLITAARRIVRGLECCVRLVHHTGKANARDSALDQYSGRGGSALADGSRMTTVMQGWRPGAGGLSPPPACTMVSGSSITVLARAKLSYAPPDLPLIWVRRTGFLFEHFMPAPPVSAEQNRQTQADQLERYLYDQLEAGRRHTMTTLEGMVSDLDMTRQALRAAVSELRVSGRLIDAELPHGERRGQRRTYLHPASYPAEGYGGIDPEHAESSGSIPPAAKPAAAYRDMTPAAGWPPGVNPPSLDPAAMDRRDTAGLAGWGDEDDEVTV